MSEIAAIEHHPFGRDLTPAQLGALAALARTMLLSPGETIFREGGDAEALYLVVRGRIALEQHVPGRGAVQLETLTGGDMLGLSWMFPGYHWVLDARATEASELVVLDAAKVRALMDADPALGLLLAKHVIRELYKRLERVRLQRLDVYEGRR